MDELTLNSYDISASQKGCSEEKICPFSTVALKFSSKIFYKQHILKYNHKCKGFDTRIH